MLHFGMNMPFYLMALYGSIMIAMVLVLRALLRSRLPKFVFPVLWSLVLLRFLIPFSVSIPLSMPVPVIPYGSNGYEATNTTLVEEKGTVTPSTTAHPGTAHLTEDTITVAVENAFTGEKIIKSHLPLFTWENVIPIIYVLGLFVTAGILGWQKYAYVRKLRDGFLVEHNETINTLKKWEMRLRRIHPYRNRFPLPRVNGDYRSVLHMYVEKHRPICGLQPLMKPHRRKISAG